MGEIEGGEEGGEEGEERGRGKREGKEGEERGRGKRERKKKKRERKEGEERGGGKRERKEGEERGRGKRGRKEGEERGRGKRERKEGEEAEEKAEDGGESCVCSPARSSPSPPPNSPIPSPMRKLHVARSGLPSSWVSQRSYASRNARSPVTNITLFSLTCAAMVAKIAGCFLRSGRSSRSRTWRARASEVGTATAVPPVSARAPCDSAPFATVVAAATFGGSQTTRDDDVELEDEDEDADELEDEVEDDAPRAIRMLFPAPDTAFSFGIGCRGGRW